MDTQRLDDPVLAVLDIQTRQLEGALVFDLQGEIDLFTSPVLREKVLTSLKKTHLPLVLNFKAVTHIDSSGLATVIEGFQASRKLRRKFALFGLTERVYNVFRIAKLSEVFAIFPNESAAVTAVQKSGS